MHEAYLTIKRQLRVLPAAAAVAASKAAACKSKSERVHEAYLTIKRQLRVLPTAAAVAASEAAVEISLQIDIRTRA